MFTRISKIVNPLNRSSSSVGRFIVSSSSGKGGRGFWEWTTQDRPLWLKDKKEGIITCVVFGITGTSSAFFVRPTVEKVFGIKGSLIEGPNSYRVVSLLCISPIYAVLLGVLGTLAGRHTFFAKMSFKILNRFLPKAVLSKAVCQPGRLKMLNTAGNLPKP
jgi:hypothetical protein